METTTTRIDFYASAVQYVDHLAPIWNRLHPDHRGLFLAGAGPAADLARLDYDIEAVTPRKRKPARSVVVASFGDLRAIAAEDVVFVEHGAGQTYSTNHPSGPGGRDRDNVRLFISPNYQTAAANTAAYSTTPNAVVGVPKLDPWHRDISRTAPNQSLENGRTFRDISRNPVVAVSFGWDRPHSPEAKSAYLHYRKFLHRVARAFPGAIAHGHPRVFPSMVADLIRFGFEPVARFNDVLDRADVYVCDNSSTIFEFASTGRPVVVLNAPWYRRHIEHGLRFWRNAGIGLGVDDPVTLNPTIELALEDPPAAAAKRQTHVDEVYPYTDGKAANRAAEAIMSLLTSQTVRGLCPVCGAAHAGCATTFEDGTPVETISELEATKMEPANYRVDRIVNGHKTTVAVTAAELTDTEAAAFGLKAGRPAANKARQPTKNKAVTTLEAPNKSDNKPEWEAYASAIGVDITDDDGNIVNKDEIIKRVEDA